MKLKLSPQTIDVLAELISGGSGGFGGYNAPPIGIYRSGPELERFMRGCNVDFHVSSSRVPSLIACIERINEGWHDDDEQRLTTILEHAADPRDFLREPEKGPVVLQKLNEALAFDDLELRLEGNRVRLVPRGQAAPFVRDLVAKAQTFNFDTVQRDLDRALDSSEADPEAAITAACSTVESMCRSILAELGKPLPAKEDVSGLYRAIREPLGIAPERTDFPPEIAADVRKVLSGLVTTIEGVGALRTHGGSAHGRQRGVRRVDARIAKLSIHAP